MERSTGLGRVRASYPTRMPCGEIETGAARVVELCPVSRYCTVKPFQALIDVSGDANVDDFFGQQRGFGA